MKTLLCAALLLCSFYSFSQTNNPAKKDTLVWTDGTKYAGTIIKEDKHTGQVQFMTEDSQMHNVSSSSIAQLKRVNEVQDNKLPPADKKAASTTSSQASVNDDTPINWSDPSIPEKIVRKHRTGIGLTVVGTVFFVAGIGLIAGGAAANGQTTTGTNAYGGTQTNVNIGATGAVGLIMTIAGLPMLIVGAVKIGKAKRLAHSRMINLR
jgi:hypothetical protein